LNIRLTTQALFALALASQAPLAAAQAQVAVNASSGQITVTPPNLPAGATGSSLTWSLASRGYTFAGTGVVISGSSAWNCVVAEGAMSVSCKQTSSPQGARFSYTLNLVPAGSNPPPVQDPDVWIVNN